MELLVPIMESAAGKEEIRLPADECIACKACEMVCAVEALTVENRPCQLSEQR
jgi:formate hydrogenlyase subunit 6/NADH:ubiquinone oxidoreductase subunit I